MPGPARADCSEEANVGIRAFPFTEADFAFLVELAQARTGISLGQKVDLVYSRLTRHLRRLHLDTFAEYCDVLRAGNEDELQAFTNSITTNLTYFFREEHHFEHLQRTVFPEMLRDRSKSQRIRIWSAGCSTGEEPYSIAMTLMESIPDLQNWEAKILATDISQKVLDQARLGIYDGEQVKGLSEERLSRWAQQGRGARSGKVRIKPELRSLVNFAHLNLMGDWPMKGLFDVIFCRNVLIYFEKSIQSRLIERYGQLMKPGGTLFIGHSESVPGIETHFESLGQTQFRKRSSS